MSGLSNSSYNKGTSYSRIIEHTKITNAHEEAKQKNQQTFDLESKSKDHEHEIKVLEKTLGWLGNFFGGKDNTAMNISGALLILLILFGIGMSILSIANCNLSNLKDIWSVITPIITLTLGYIFGSKPSEKQ